jgi:hypothetical protein
MPLPFIIINRGYFLVVCLLLSIIISIIIATAVPLEKDELGALVNIYLPVFTGAATLLIYGAVVLISKNIKLRLLVLVLFASISIFTGVILNLSFYSFNRQLQTISASNVLPSVTSPDNDKIEIRNLDNFPTGNRAVFSYTYDPNLPYGANKHKNTIINHDATIVRIINHEKKSITIKEASFSSKGLWAASIANKQNEGIILPATILPGDSLDVSIIFTAKALNKRVESIWWKAALKFQHFAIGIARLFNYQLPYGSTCANINGQLLFKTADRDLTLKPVQLNGIWEYRYENDWEPGLQMILNSLNFKTKVGFTYFDNGLKGEKTTDWSDEIAADYFEVANASQPVKIRKIASYHGCCTVEDSDTLAIYDLNRQLTRQLQYTNKYSGQMLLPLASEMPDSKHLSNLSGPFAVKIGLSFTDRTRNHDKKIGIRVWKAVDEHGKVIDNAYILGSDYLGKKGTNYDYQDNVYYIENIKLYNNKSTIPLMAQK